MVFQTSDNKVGIVRLVGSEKIVLMDFTNGGQMRQLGYLEDRVTVVQDDFVTC